jgi:hypothetical protein
MSIWRRSGISLWQRSRKPFSPSPGRDGDATAVLSPPHRRSFTICCTEWAAPRGRRRHTLRLPRNARFLSSSREPGWPVSSSSKMIRTS